MERGGVRTAPSVGAPATDASFEGDVIPKPATGTVVSPNGAGATSDAIAAGVCAGADASANAGATTVATARGNTGDPGTGRWSARGADPSDAGEGAASGGGGEGMEGWRVPKAGRLSSHARATLRGSA